MLTNRQVKTPSSSSLLLPRCLEARPWPGWGTLLPLTPQGAPCPEPALPCAAAECPQSPQGKQLCCSCQQLEPLLWGLCLSSRCQGSGDRGCAPAFSFIPLARSRQGPRPLLRDGWQLLRPRSPSTQPLPWSGWLCVRLLQINTCKYCISQMPFAEGGGACVFEEGFSSIIT